MKELFVKYCSVGVLNTVLHWAVFLSLVHVLNLSQAIANFFGFYVSVTFSFFMNASFTYNSKASLVKYLYFVFFMGAMSFLLGALSDYFELNPIVTLVSFSSVSLIFGFYFSKSLFKG